MLLTSSLVPTPSSHSFPLELLPHAFPTYYRSYKTHNVYIPFTITRGNSQKPWLLPIVYPSAVFPSSAPSQLRISMAYLLYAYLNHPGRDQEGSFSAKKSFNLNQRVQVFNIFFSLPFSRSAFAFAGDFRTSEVEASLLSPGIPLSNFKYFCSANFLEF